MKIKRILSIALSLLMILGFSSVFAGCNKNKGPNHFTYWMGTQERSTYYRTYDDNPIMKYVTSNLTFDGDNGEDQKIELTFQHPPLNGEVDTLNNMMSTGSYPEIIDTAYGTAGNSIDQLYKDGIIIDLTEYVDKYMPNYKKLMNDNPELLPYLTTMIDGERKILKIGGVYETVDWTAQFYGICYRRDWIVKYAKDSGGNKLFTGSFADASDPDSWTDNVTFPSWEKRNVEYDGTNRGMKWYAEWCAENGVVWDGTDPVTISDWEWMLDLFKTALSDLKITDGYPMSLYSPGYIANGDLVCAFGGGGPIFYKDAQTGQAAFGAVGDGFKAYLKCMNQWYKKGWIDSGFMNNTDAFYQIDEDLTTNGKVGLWNSMPSSLGNRLKKDSTPLTTDMVVYGAAQPINDMSTYGGADQRMKIPYTMFQADKLGGGIVVTHKAVDNKKDIGLFCSFLDYFFSDEGSLLKTYGFSKEQQQQLNDPLYNKYNLNDGAYTTEVIDGVTYYQKVALIEEDRDGIQSAMNGSRIPGISRNKYEKYGYNETYLNSRMQWVKYPNTGFFGGMANSLLKGEDSSKYEAILNKIEQQYMYKSVWPYIKGDKDIDSNWSTFCSDLKKRDYETALALRNKAIALE